MKRQLVFECAQCSKPIKGKFFLAGDDQHERRICARCVNAVANLNTISGFKGDLVREVVHMSNGVQEWTHECKVYPKR